MPVEFCSKCGSDNIITAESHSEKNYGKLYEKCGQCGNFEAWVAAPARGSRGRGGGRGGSGYSRGGSGGSGYIPRQQHVNQNMLPPKRQRPQQQQPLDYGNEEWGEEWQNEDDSHYAEVEEPGVSSSSSSSSSCISSDPAVRHQPGHPTSKMQPDSAISLILAAYRDALNVQDKKFDELQKTNASLLALVKELSQSVAALSQQIADLTAPK